MGKLTLFENAFSPFARKVRMVLEHKGLEFESVDGLHVTGREALARVNPRKEVTVLVDGGTVVVNSAHIVAYLEAAYPNPPVLPGDAAARAHIRHWERVADTLLDPIVVDVSLWSWAKRHDSPPEGLREAAVQGPASGMEYVLNDFNIRCTFLAALPSGLLELVDDFDSSLCKILFKLEIFVKLIHRTSSFRRCLKGMIPADQMYVKNF